MDRYKTRKVRTGATASYQLGHYEMTGDPGSRRSVFKVDVHLGEYATADEALAEWPRQITRLREIGRESAADRLEAKLTKLQELTRGDQ